MVSNPPETIQGLAILDGSIMSLLLYCTIAIYQKQVEIYQMKKQRNSCTIIMRERVMVEIISFLGFIKCSNFCETC